MGMDRDQDSLTSGTPIQRFPTPSGGGSASLCRSSTRRGIPRPSPTGRAGWASLAAHSGAGVGRPACERGAPCRSLGCCGSRCCTLGRAPRTSSISPTSGASTAFCGSAVPMGRHAKCRSGGMNYWFDSDGSRTRSRYANSAPPCGLVTFRWTMAERGGRGAACSRGRATILGSVFAWPACGQNGVAVAHSASRGTGARRAGCEPLRDSRSTRRCERRSVRRPSRGHAVDGRHPLCVGQRCDPVSGPRRWGATVDRIWSGRQSSS